jgi:hypothetical protein
MRFCVYRHATRLAFLLSVLTVLLAPARASAQDLGVRGGVSINPDQGYFGLHFETKPLVDHLYFRPNAEVGFGDGTVLTALNMEFVYKFPSKNQWRLYAGGGPALNIYNADSSTDTQGGLNLLVGAEQRNGLFFELKIGVVDSPDAKFGVGYTWR